MSVLLTEGEQAGEGLIVLTRDELLMQTLEAVAPEHALSFLSDESDLATHLAGGHIGVAILDAASTRTPIAQLTERLRKQFPDLVLIVAGGAEHQAALSAQVTRGTVYRFLHKPVSAPRVKLFVEAAWRRHDVRARNHRHVRRVAARRAAERADTVAQCGVGRRRCRFARHRRHAVARGAIQTDRPRPVLHRIHRPSS